MFKYYYVIFLAAMFWMASAASAQQLPANASGAPLNVAVTQAYGDLNHDGEVNLADINILVGIILSGEVVTDPYLTPNMTIAEFKAKHWREAVSYADTVTDNEVIHGWVVANDISGNIYKSLYIMDESGAGLCVSVNFNGLYQDFPLGQEIILPMKGYWVGKYTGSMQIGYPTYYFAGDVWEMNFLPVSMWFRMALPNGDPDASRVTPIELELSDIIGNNDAETLLKYQGALVRFNGVHFLDAGNQTPFAGTTGVVNRIIADADGNQLMVRNSSYSNFAEELLPSGDVAVTGVLGFHATKSNSNGDWYLYLRDRNDVEGGYIDHDTDEVDPVTTLDESFNHNIPEEWLSYAVQGDKTWYQGSYAVEQNCYAAMTGYRGNNPPFDAWLITPALDIEHAANKTLSFRTEVNGYGSTTSRLEVYLLNSRTVETATVKVKLNPVLATAPAAGYSQWVNSGDIDLSPWADGVYYIGFRYYADPDVNYATWCLDDVRFGL